MGEKCFSLTRSGFRCYYPCEINISHIPKSISTYDTLARGKDKKTNSHTSIRDVRVMLIIRHHVASQRIQDFLEVFFTFFQYKMRYLVVSKKKNQLLDRKIRP